MPSSSGSAWSPYEPPFRQRLTAWGVRNRLHIGEVHIAHRSVLVRMGVSVADIALGGIIQAHSDLSSLTTSYLAIVKTLREERVAKPTTTPGGLTS